MSESDQEQSSPKPLSPRTSDVRAGLRRNFSSSRTDSKSYESEGSSKMAEIPNNNNNVEGGGALVVQPQKPPFELKSGMIHLLPTYYGNTIEDPYMHIKQFFEICATIKIQGLDDEQIKMRLFPFKLSNKFLQKFFPAQKTNKIRKEILGFTQKEGEAFHECWERYKEMISSCPHHNIESWMQMQSFYEGLLDFERMMVDATSGEGLMNKTAYEAFTLFEFLSANSQQWSHNKGRGAPMKAVVYEVSTNNEIAAKLDVMNPNNDPYSNTYNPRWRNHPNFKWSNNPNVQQSQGPPPGFQIQQRQFRKAPQQVQEQRGDQMGELQDMFKKFMGQQMQTNQNLQNAVNKLEVQVGQIASSMSNRASGTFPSQTTVNPRHHEQVKAVHILRSDKKVDNKSFNPFGKITNPKVSSNANQVPISTNAFRPIAPFPSRLSMSKKDQGLDEILETFKKVQISIPLLNAITQIPKKLPPKLKDPGSFSIPCIVGDFKFQKTLFDLGASINLIPCHVYEKLNLGELQATTVSIQLADRTIRYPKGILEDVLVNVEGLILPADFLVLEMEEALIPNNELPLIFGRPFMATAKTKIDVEQGTLTMTVNGETVALKVFDALKPNVVQDCFQIEVFGNLGKERFDGLPYSVESCLLKRGDKEEQEAAHMFNATIPT
ncbi:unnamed protein product [Prunus armeniaca]